MTFEVDKDVILSEFENKPIRRPRRFVEPILDFAAEAVTAYDLDKLIARTTIAEPHFRKVVDVFPILQEKGLRFNQMTDALVEYVVNTTEEEHQQNMAKGKVGKSIDEILENMEESEGESPGKNGGEPLGSFFQGHRARQSPENFKVDLPPLVDLDVLSFAKGLDTQEFVEGKPRVKKGLRLLRRIEDVFFASRRDLASDADFFYLQVAQKSMVVRPPLKLKSQRRDLIVLLDDSGSMAGRHTVDYVLHVLNTLFEYVLDGKIRMLFAPFEDKRDTLFEVHDLQSVNFLKEKFRHGSGGTTYLGDILPALAAEIRTGMVDGIKLSTETNILIINDGNDWIPDIKMPVVTHCISLEDLNHGLEKVCKDSGGQYYMPFERMYAPDDDEEYYGQYDDD